ncbi:MAG: hypothetical protein SPJ13_08360 [Bacteroidales bacterium]|nr:hypothetical protein [Bacteroidales bacterium]
MKTRTLLPALLLAAALPLVAQAQNGINEPYSQYGIGSSIIPANLPWCSAFGGAAYTQRGNTFINTLNPASYAAVGMQALAFDMGFNVQMSTLKDPQTSLYDADANLGYISLAFPVAKWWKAAVGLAPLSNVDYSSVQGAKGATFDTMSTIYEGYGGVNYFFLGSGFNIGQRLSLGFNANLLFGTITRAITYDFVQNDSSAFLDSRKQKDSRINGITLDFGAQYRLPLGEKHSLNLALTLKVPRTMTVNDNALSYTFVTNGGMEYIRDTIFPRTAGEGSFSSTLQQPFTLGVGAGLERNELWQAAIDFTYAPWSGMKYTEKGGVNLFGRGALAYGKNGRLNMGIRWMGDKGSSHYLRRMEYSAGFHYEKGKLRLALQGEQEKSIDEWGFGFGTAFPMRKGRSALRLSASYASMGSPDMLRHNYFVIGISVGSSDSWFVKRRYE